MLKHKIAFVVQRYGEDVVGGSEFLCRLVAERLTKEHRVTILTTCAKDYLSWRNEYPPGDEEINSVLVKRFPTTVERNTEEFNRLSDTIFGQRHSSNDEIEWLERQGPVCPDLLEFLKGNKDSYDCFIFFTYLYYTTFYGLPLVGPKSILVPTAHDEPPIHLGIFRSLFLQPKAIAYNTEEERCFVQNTFGNADIFNEVVGVGIEAPAKPDAARFREKHHINQDFVLFVGRLDELKGFDLFKNFLAYKKSRRLKGKLKLVLLGQATTKLPKDSDIVSLGFVSEQDKFDAMAAAAVLIMPSRYESLSMVVLESMFSETPVLVNEDSEVLKGHCLCSNAGLYYSDYDEFAACLDLLLEHGSLSKKMGENGRRYVQTNYSWEEVLRKYRCLLERVIGKKG